ncbi:MAG: nucleotidyltransferase domain-containing protein [Nanoarchaeota archaeon]|nr:nucleotidyltransferase domain-containing protein [Nanoarchaeota archaeon]
MEEKITDYKLKILGLYRTDYLAKYHIREMARLIGKSHVTLLPHLRSLEQNRILVSGLSGKNKAYSLNMDNALAKDYLALAETSESINYLEQTFLIKKIHSEMLKLDLQGSLILFGSYANRTYRDGSDIDLFYLGKLEEKQARDIKKIGKLYGKTINVKTASLENFERGSRAKDALITEVIKNHIILQQPGIFINALWRYFSEIRRD